MQPSRDTVYIAPGEWRWVVFCGVGLVLLAFLPFIWVAFSGANQPNMQFMGVLSNYRDGATYLSKMLQGYEGQWLVNFRHTPEDHNAIFIQVLYPALGHVARLVNIPPIAIFHVARVIASLVMYLGLYYLGATIWPRVRSRRIFFAIVALGSGLGWLLLFTGDTSAPDLSIPEMYPFFSSLVNVHFPLTIACLALMVSTLIVVFRPGSTFLPQVNNGGLLVGLLSFTISVLYPQALVPLAIAVGLYVLLFWLHQKRLTIRELRWGLLIVLPALPMATYLVAIVNYNDAVRIWNTQNFTGAPSPVALLFGLGVPLLIALPGIWQALRRFEQDGDRLMLMWILAIVVAMYLPTNVQRRFAVGLMIPIAYFVTRSLEVFWFKYVNRRWRYRLFILVVPAMTMSYVFVLMSSVSATGPFLQRDYAVVLQWLRTQTRSTDVVLASPETSIWIPGWVGSRVVYGHPYETLDATAKEQAVLAWFGGELESACAQLLRDYNVRYILYGPQERALGQTNCLDSLTEVAQFGSVQVYAP